MTSTITEIETRNRAHEMFITAFGCIEGDCVQGTIQHPITTYLGGDGDGKISWGGATYIPNITTANEVQEVER